jgi:iron complex transport system substrate-binding protein
MKAQRPAWPSCAAALLLLGCLSACQPAAPSPAAAVPGRIVSLSGTLSEIVHALGHGQRLVGVDVTSTYPPALASVPKVGHNRQISAEGVLSLQPQLVLARCQDLAPSLLQQLEATQVKVVCLEQTYSVAGTQRLVMQVGEVLGEPARADSLQKAIGKACASTQRLVRPGKLLFIYARGAGTLMVAGQDTPIDALIRLAGGQNAAQGFSDFQPLTAEALVDAAPDVVLLFTSGLSSLGGPAGMLEVPGMAMTPAGKRQAFVALDGQLLTGFGPRLAQAIDSLCTLANPYLLQQP